MKKRVNKENAIDHVFCKQYPKILEEVKQKSLLLSEVMGVEKVEGMGLRGDRI